jgi:hypothetical protein
MPFFKRHFLIPVALNPHGNNTCRSYLRRDPPTYTSVGQEEGGKEGSYLNFSNLSHPEQAHIPQHQPVRCLEEETGYLDLKWLSQRKHRAGEVSPCLNPSLLHTLGPFSLSGTTWSFPSTWHSFLNNQKKAMCNLGR